MRKRKKKNVRSKESSGVFFFRRRRGRKNQWKAPSVCTHGEVCFARRPGQVVQDVKEVPNAVSKGKSKARTRSGTAQQRAMMMMKLGASESIKTSNDFFRHRASMPPLSLSEICTAGELCDHAGHAGSRKERERAREEGEKERHTSKKKRKKERKAAEARLSSGRNGKIVEENRRKNLNKKKIFSPPPGDPRTRPPTGRGLPLRRCCPLHERPFKSPKKRKKEKEELQLSPFFSAAVSSLSLFPSLLPSPPPTAAPRTGTPEQTPRPSRSWRWT